MGTRKNLIPIKESHSHRWSLEQKVSTSQQRERGLRGACRSRDCMRCPIAFATLIICGSFIETPITPAIASAFSDESDNDYSALSALYMSTSGNTTWLTKSGWMSDLPCMTPVWFGVKCSLVADGIKVLTDINLGSNHLSGSLPTEIGLMTRVTNINIPTNVLDTGTLPTEIGFMTNLALIDLESNSLKGSLPTQTGYLKAMKSTFDMSWNSFVGTLPTEIGHLTKMEHYFFISMNSIVGAIPTQMGRLSMVDTDLTLNSNSISGTIPTEIGSMSLLAGINFNTNFISGTTPTQFGLMTGIRNYVYLSDNRINGSIPTQIGRMTSLTENFNLDDNSLGGKFPSQIGCMTSFIKNFNLSSNSITGSVPTQIGSMTDITLMFNIQHNRIESSLPTQIGGMTKLTMRFQSHNNYMNGTIPTQIGRMTEISGYLQINTNFITGSIPTQIGRMTELFSNLDISFNSINGMLPTQIGLISMANYFSLNDNSIIGAVPTQIGRISTMYSGIYFQKNLFKKLPTEIGQMTALNQLYAFNNSMHGVIPSQIGVMAALTQALLHSNKLRHSIPSQIGSLRNLKYLVLDDNKLESTLPNTFCNLTDLVVLSAARNSLTGHVPSCVLQSMQVFNLADNDFHGELPSVLNWPQLAYLLLSNNKFHGSVSALQLNGSTLSSGYNENPLVDDPYHNNHPVYYGGNLLALTLHKNKLDKPLPRDLVLPRTLNTFTIFENQIPGRVPHGLLSQQNGTDMMLLMSSNRLSCHLPDWDFTTTNSSLVLVGNFFSKNRDGQIPLWVPNGERDAKFLSTVVRPQWSKLLFPSWLETLILFLVALIIAIPIFRTDIVLQSEGAILVLRCSRAVAKFSLVVVPCLLIIINVASALNYSYFQCGEALLKYTTLAYLTDSPFLEGLAAGFMAAYTLALAVLLAHFVPPAKHGNSVSLDEPLLKEERDSLPDFPLDQASWLVSFDENEKEEIEVQPIPRRQSRAPLLGIIGAALLVLSWLSALLIVGGVPTIFYVMTYSLPEQEYIPTKLQGGLGGFLALYLTVVSSFVIPVLSRRTAQLILYLLRFDLRKRHALSTIMSILMRTLLIIVVPCVAVIIFNDGCNRGWTNLWSECTTSEKTFSQSSGVEYFQFNDNGFDVLGSLTFNLVDHDDVCPKVASAFHKNTNHRPCGRSLLSVLGPLFLNKLIYAIIFSSLEPHVRRVKVWTRKKWFEQPSNSIPGWWVPAHEMRRSYFENSIYACTAISEPDPMLRLMWFETALTFGALIPLLLPLLALQLRTDAIVFEWLLRQTSASPLMRLPVQRRAMQWHVVLVLGMHCIMTAFFFIDGDFNGRWLLAAVLWLLWIGFIFVQVTGARFYWRLHRRFRFCVFGIRRTAQEMQF